MIDIQSDSIVIDNNCQWLRDHFTYLLDHDPGRFRHSQAPIDLKFLP